MKGQEQHYSRRGDTVFRVFAGILLVGVVSFIWWGVSHTKELDEERREQASDERREADSKLPLISASDLFSEYEQDQSAATEKYGGHRYRIIGRAFDPRVLKFTPADVQGFVKFTAGFGDPADHGDRAIYAYSAAEWVTALSSLKVGDRAIAACTIDPLKKGIQNPFSTSTNNRYLTVFDCGYVVTGLERGADSPFSSQ
jgi:hypothetical protein